MDRSLDSLTRAPGAPSRRPRLPAWTIPVGIVLGFALLFLLLFRDRLLPAPEVEVAVVLATSRSADEAPASSGGPAGAAAMAFQASGWVEPDPLPIKATALVDGVIDEVLVLEGERVERGQLLATLIDDDHRLALKASRTRLAVLVGQREAHDGAIETARRTVSGARARAEASAAVVRGAEDRIGRLERVGSGAVSEMELVSRRSLLEKARAERVALEAAVEEAQAEVARHELMAEVREQEVAAARVEVEQAELALARTRIESPVDGRVLRLHAAPGKKKMLAMDGEDSATVAILYDPDHLQVRVDVPLADAAGLRVGQAARIRCSLLPDSVFHGEVSRITGEADLQRNTLQAKVRIQDPSDQLRPEMLCRVEFLEAVGNGAMPASAGASLATWVPEAALGDGLAWVCDPDSRRVEAREVRPGGESEDGFLRVDEGLRPGEWVVLSPEGLRDGQRVTPKLLVP